MNRLIEDALVDKLEEMEDIEDDRLLIIILNVGHQWEIYH